ISEEMLESYGLDLRLQQGDIAQLDGQNLVNITNKEWSTVSIPAHFKLEPYIAPRGDAALFPYYDNSVSWSNDNYGPIWIPGKGKSIELTADNLIRYGRCISVYEGNKLEE